MIQGVSAESVFAPFPWPQFEAAPEAHRKLAGGNAPGNPTPNGLTPRRGAGTSATSTGFPDPSGVDSTSTVYSGGIAGHPPANVPHPSGMLSPDALAKIRAVAEAAREVRRVRAEALPKLKGGLRALYRTLELPGANPLKDDHAALDAAVLTAYGFDAKKDLLAQLLALNLAVAARIERHEPVTAPGLPPGFPEPLKLVTEDCLQPMS